MKDDREGSVPDQSTVRRVRTWARPPTTAFELVVLEGPDTGKRVQVDPTSSACVLVGKSALCGLRLDDAAVGARHFSLQIVNGRLHVIDLASGGTKVNGVLAREAFLTGGELIRVGESVLCVHRTESKASPERRPTSFGRIQGESVAMRELYATFARLIHSSRPILVEGEAGVGKRLLAEELHQTAFGKDAPFVAFALREATPEQTANTLFAPGGLVDQARGGTLFVKELLDLDPASQEKLAAVVISMAREPEHRRARLVGASRGTPLAGQSIVDALASLFAATHITLPPLRAREGDVGVLGRLFWRELAPKASVPDDLAARFEGHAWPGNIRELRAAVQDRVRHGHDAEEPAVVAVPRANDPLSRVIERDLPFVESRNAVLAEFEKRYVDRALVRSNRSVARAAAASGIAHRYFQVLRSRYRTA